MYTFMKTSVPIQLPLFLYYEYKTEVNICFSNNIEGAIIDLANIICSENLISEKFTSLKLVDIQ